jgi:hypothetical protein
LGKEKNHSTITMMTNQSIEYNRLGLIPGPNEEERAYYERATYALQLKNHIPKMLAEELPFAPEEMNASTTFLKEGCEESIRLYNIYPEWVPLFFSNYKLSFWVGGCAWIFQHTKESPTSAFFQLRNQFKTSDTYLGIYNRTELLSHELSHVGRMMFEEPKFEEVLAYRSSKSKFRQFFGPIVQSSYESMIFVLFLVMVIALDFYDISNDAYSPSSLSFWGRIGLLILVISGVARVCLRQYQFKKCLDNLKKLFDKQETADAVIYRLTDNEIQSFGRLTPEEIKNYAQQKKDFRWKVIYEAYFNK